MNSLDWMTLLRAELTHNHARIQDISLRLKTAKGVEKETLEGIMDVLQDDQDMICQELDLYETNLKK